MMSKKLKLGILFIVIVGAVGVLCLAQGLIKKDVVIDDRPVEIEGAGERIIMDELSLWNSQSNSGISYDQFEPLRVRTDNADYYPRTDTGNKKFAASGKNYGEIRLTGTDGHLLYLPRFVAYGAGDALKLSIRQKSEQGKWRIAIYPAADQIAYISADSAGVTVEQKGDWQEVTIPLSSLAHEPFKLEYKETKTWREPNHLLSQYKLPKGYLYGIDFALVGGQAGDSLYIDRIVLAKPKHTANDHIAGELKPSVDGAEILLRSDRGDQKVAVEKDGSFSVPIPEGAKIIEVVAQTKDKVMSPHIGRFLEVGTYLPKITIPMEDPVLEDSLGASNTNESLYIYDEKYGPRLEPDMHFLVQVSTNDEPVTESELATNHLGYIDRDRNKTNPDDAYRVMVLGECHHMGLHIAQSDLWWNEAEAVATMTAKRPIELISISSNHASFTSSWPAFRDFSEELKPDIVLLPMIDPGVLNLTIEEYMMDWLGASKDHRPAYQFEFGPDGKIVHKPHDPDWQLYREPIPEADHKRIREQYLSTPYVYADNAQTPAWVKENIRLSIASLAEFAKLAKQRNTRFAILYISNFGASKKEIFDENGAKYDPNKFRDLMREIATKSGLEFIDVSNELHMSMNGEDKGRIFFANNGHFTPYAHYRYGQVLGNLFSSWVNAE